VSERDVLTDLAARMPFASIALHQPHASRRTALLVGIGLMAGIDELVFHQILGWHHFYDRSTPAIGLLSDGLLHAAELIALVAGFTGLLKLRRRNQLDTRQAWAGVFLGMGGFQLFDGLIDHKVLRLHQIRYGVELWPYDLVWNLSALSLLLIGLVLARRGRPNPA